MAAERTARELKADDTRKRVFAAAAELFATRGYHDVTVAEIARRARVAKGTFFVHFATKDAVVTELVRIQTRAARKARARVLESGGTAVEALRATTLMLGEQAGASRELSRAVLTATLENAEVGGASRELFDEVFAEMCVDSKAAFGDDSAARALMASYLGAAYYFSSTPVAGPMLEVLTPLVDMNLAGFERNRQSTEGKHAARARRADHPSRRR
jgi:AcrR family transcriptional regulator